MAKGSEMTEFHKTVKAFSIGNGMTMESIQKAVGCGNSAFYSKLDGRSAIEFGEAYRFANILGMSMDRLYEIVPKRNHE